MIKEAAIHRWPSAFNMHSYEASWGLIPAVPPLLVEKVAAAIKQGTTP